MAPSSADLAAALAAADSAAGLVASFALALTIRAIKTRIDQNKNRSNDKLIM